MGNAAPPAPLRVRSTSRRDPVPQASTTHRFVVLDGCRGLAALSVVLYHAGTARGLPWLGGRAYLAVDFFFVLSGFVLAHAYEPRLRVRSLSPLEFYGIRFRRLWPMAIIGTLLGVALLGSRSWSTLLALVFAALLLPDLQPGASAFPLNPPQWSIFLEIAANYLYALIAPRLMRRVLLSAVGVSALWLAVDTLRAGDANHIDAARVMFGFFVGVAIYRVWHAGVRVNTASATLVAIALAVCLFAPAMPHIGVAATDAATQLLAFPLLVWLGASASVGPRVSRACEIAGVASYPLYALHYPVLVSLLTH
jgi:peptidoglycan/LPS O-acetylase OafA/YrhL